MSDPERGNPDGGSYVLIFVLLLALVAALAGCTSIEASNDYIAIETCVSWERA